jgi:hypothetical protein
MGQEGFFSDLSSGTHSNIVDGGSLRRGAWDIDRGFYQQA